MPRRRGKREFASIRQLPSTRWQVRYTGPDGIRRNAPHTFLHRVDADAYVEAKRREIYYQTWDDDKPEPVTFGVYATRWLSTRQASGRPIKQRTREHYQSLLDDHLLDTFGSRQIAAIKPRDVRQWYEDTLVDRPTKRSHTYALLHAIMNTAVNDELIDANPCRIVGASTAKRAHKIRPASIDELAVFTAEMPERLRLMVTLAAWCAMRYGETVELRRGDIDLNQQVIHVRRAAVRVKGAYIVTTPKSEAGVRDIDIPPHVIPAIEDHLSNHVARGRDSLIFPAANGAQLQPSTLYRHWYRARAKANRKDLRWHDLRHTGAVLAASTGATLAELMQRLGHSSPDMAMNYQHVAQGRGREIAALLSKMAQE